MYELPPTSGLPLTWRDLIGDSEDLETALASYLNVHSVQVESSGTACLIIVLESLKKLSQRRRVIIPAYTCPLVPLAISQAGLEVVLCDLDSNSLDMDTTALASLCDETTLAVIPTHLAGLPVDVPAISKIANAYGIYVIEDAAQALGARWQTQFTGTLADIGIFSLSFGKGLTIGEGGFVYAKDSSISKLIGTMAKQLRSNAFSDELRQIVQLVGYKLLYNTRCLPLIYGNHLRSRLRQNKLEEAVGDVFELPLPVGTVGIWRKSVAKSALGKLPAFLYGNRKRGLERSKLINDLAGAYCYSEKPSAQGSWPFLFVTMKDRETRDLVMNQLWSAGLGVTRLFINDLTEYDYLRDIVQRTNVPNAQRIAETGLTITNSPWLGERHFMAIVEVLKQCGTA